IGYRQKSKNKAKSDKNRARDWKKREKTKLKAYLSQVQTKSNPVNPLNPKIR
ncbi:hypothetical protein Tco_1127398, partial [Tanacetum coccineum]